MLSKRLHGQPFGGGRTRDSGPEPRHRHPVERGVAGPRWHGAAHEAASRPLARALLEIAAHADRERLAREVAPLKRRLRALLEPHRKTGTRNRHFRTFACNLLKLWPALWTFTEIEGVEADQQQSRARIAWRRHLPQGFAWQPVGGGERFAERMLSVSLTCRLQGRSLFGFLVEAITASSRASPAPSLV